MQQWPEKRRFNLGINQSINQSLYMDYHYHYHHYNRYCSHVVVVLLLPCL